MGVHDKCALGCSFLGYNEGNISLRVYCTIGHCSSYYNPHIAPHPLWAIFHVACAGQVKEQEEEEKKDC